MPSKQLDTTTRSEVDRWIPTLQRAVRSAFLRGNGVPVLLRLSVPVEAVDPFAWLAGRRESDRILWRARHHNKIRAMCGSVALVRGRSAPNAELISTEIDAFLSRPGDEMRFFGGMRFDPTGTCDPTWDGFPAYRFVLPRFELHCRGQHAQMYCNLAFPEDSDRLEEILEEVSALADGASDLARELPEPSHRVDEPDETRWKQSVSWALEAFGEHDFEKVVLARKTDFEFVSDVDPFLLLKRLSASTPNCFHFHFEAEDGSSFLGATPERLFYRNGLQIDSEAVAGTRPRGITRADDDALCASLLASEKDRREHAYVRDVIEETLNHYCDPVTVDHEASEMRLARGRHLVSRISGVLSRPVSDFELLAHLHPTPAVGGNPTDFALGVIRELERFDRGWYAGPVGWVGRDAAEFAVALRCGLVSENRLSLFSGAGIVRGSEPGLEWQEIEQKIVDFVNVIGLDVASPE